MCPYMPNSETDKAIQNIDKRIESLPQSLKTPFIALKRYVSNYSPSTARIYMQQVLRYIDYLQSRENNNNIDIYHNGDLRLINLNIRDFKAIIDTRQFIHTDRPSKQSSSRMFVHAIRIFYQAGYGLCILPPNVKINSFYNIRPPYRGEVHLISDVEFERIIETATTHLEKAIFYLLGTSGLRANEICNLKNKDLFWEENRIFVEYGKRGAERSTLFSRRAQEYVRTYLDRRENLKDATDYVFYENPETQKRITHNFIYYSLLGIGKRALIQKRLYPHLLRHYFFTNLALKKTPLKIIQTLAGHKNMGTTGIYLDLSEQAEEDFFRNAPVD